MNRKFYNIQENYCDLVLSHFVTERKELKKNGRISTSPLIIMPSQKGWCTNIEKKVENYLNDIRLFWSENYEDLLREMETYEGLGIVIWGDMPIDILVPKFSLYFDTIAIPDAVSYIEKNIFHDRNVLERMYKSFVGWTLLIEDLRLAFDTKLERPIAFVFPQKLSLNDAASKDLVVSILKKTNIITGKLLREIFHTEHTHETPDSFSDEIHSKNFVNLYENLDIDALIELLSPIMSNLQYLPLSNSEGFDNNLLKRIKSRTFLHYDPKRIYNMIVSAYYVNEARSLNANIVGLDNSLSPEFIQFINKKNDLLLKDIKNKMSTFEEDVLAFSFIHRFKWLDNLLTEDAVKLRMDGSFESIRELFRIDRRLLKNATIEDYPKLAKDIEDRLVSTIEAEIKNKENFLKELHRKTRNTLISFGTSAALGIASLAFPELLPLSFTSAGYGIIVGGSSIKDIINNHLSGKEKVEYLGQRSISYLINSYEQYNRGHH